MLLLRMDDNMNRQLTCEFTLTETPQMLASELVTHGFINIEDSSKITELIKDAIANRLMSATSPTATAVNATAAPAAGPAAS
jgi:hypothetical protein